MVLCHKWDVKNDFAYVLQFFSLISDGLGSVLYLLQIGISHHIDMINNIARYIQSQYKILSDGVVA